MADKNTTTTTTTEQPDVVIRARGFWDKYSKPIIYIGSAIILAIGGWYAYQNFYVAPKEKKASELIFPAENLFDKMGNTGFNKDSVNTVLNGGSLEGAKVTGILSIINNYGGTETGNRAKYIAGASYFHIGEFDKAIKFMKDFDANGAAQVQSKAYIILGHAYAEKNNVDEALSYYKKAATVNTKDESSTSYALLMAASYAAEKQKKKEAIDLFTELKNKFPTSSAVSSGDVEKQLAALGEFK
ncbi:hypothetical protein BH11BAC4_BH11BAC4_26040 [soil metagenome]